MQRFGIIQLKRTFINGWPSGSRICRYFLLFFQIWKMFFFPVSIAFYGRYVDIREEIALFWSCPSKHLQGLKPSPPTPNFKNLQNKTTTIPSTHLPSTPAKKRFVTLLSVTNLPLKGGTFSAMLTARLLSGTVAGHLVTDDVKECIRELRTAVAQQLQVPRFKVRHAS